MKTKLPKAILLCALFARITGGNSWAVESSIQCDNFATLNYVFRRDCEALLSGLHAPKGADIRHTSDKSKTRFWKDSCYFSISYTLPVGQISQAADLELELPTKIFVRLLQCVRDGPSGGTVWGWAHRAGDSVRYSAYLEDVSGTKFYRSLYDDDDELTTLLGESPRRGPGGSGNLYVPGTYDDSGGRMTPDLDHLLLGAPADIENQLDPHVPSVDNLDPPRLQSISIHDPIDPESSSDSEASTATADNSTCYAKCSKFLKCCYNDDRFWTRMLQIITGATAVIGVPAAILKISARGTSDEVVRLCTEAVNQGVRFPGCP